MSKQQIKKDFHGYYPKEIHNGDDFQAVESVCSECNERIIQPLLTGIWYHKDRWGVSHKKHVPVPATIIQQLFYFLTKSRGYDTRYEKTKKCKCMKHWNQLLGFKKIKVGFHGSHYYFPDFKTRCGRIMALDKRKLYVDDKPKFPTRSDSFDCQRCINGLIKDGIITVKYDRRKYSWSPYRTYKITWVKKQ